MMHLATTFIALTYALSGNLRTSLTHAPETPSSFIQKGSPDSFADLDAKLKQMEEKTKAKLQADTAAPSSLVEEGSPDSFADLDAKLKQMEEKTKAELAKLQADTAAPSSFVEEGAPRLAGYQRWARHLAEKTKAELAKLPEDTAAPSSLLDTNTPEEDERLQHLESKATDDFKDMEDLTASIAPASVAMEGLTDGKDSKDSSHLDAAAPSSFAEDAYIRRSDIARKRLERLRRHNDDLLDDMKIDRKFPTSFLESTSPDSFADLDAKLKQLEDKTKAELAKLQADTAAPSSFAQMRRGDTKGDDDNDDDDDDDDNSIDGNVDYGQLKKQMVDMQSKLYEAAKKTAANQHLADGFEEKIQTKLHDEEKKYEDKLDSDEDQFEAKVKDESEKLKEKREAELSQVASESNEDLKRFKDAMSPSDNDD